MRALFGSNANTLTRSPFLDILMKVPLQLGDMNFTLEEFPCSLSFDQWWISVRSDVGSWGAHLTYHEKDHPREMEAVSRIHRQLGCGAALLLPLLQKHTNACWAAMVHLNEGWTAANANTKALGSEELLRRVLRRWRSHCVAESEKLFLDDLARSFSLAL